MRPPKVPIRTLAIIGVSFLLCPLHSYAGDSPFTFNGGKLEGDEEPPNFSDQAESAGFTEETAFGFNGAQIPINLHPISRIHVLDESVFKPSLQVHLHSLQLEDGKPDMLIQATIEHEHYPYVNLESIEPFLDEPVTCRMARADEETDLDLYFETDAGYNMARKHWGAENATIRFVVEGLHCFEAAGSRSVYHATEIQFQDNRKVVIRAEPLHTQVYWGSGWGHTLRLRSIAQPIEHVIMPRHSVEISHDVAQLRKREWNIDFKHDGFNATLHHTFNHDLGARHQFFDKPKWYNGPFLNFSCVNCHARGVWHASFDLQINISPFKNREECKHQKPAERKRSAEAVAFQEQHASIQPLIYARMEAERILRHRSDIKKGHDLRKRGVTLYQMPEQIECTEDDPTYPVCHEQQMPRAIRERSDGGIDKCNQFLRPLRAVGKAVSCTFKMITGNEECGKKFLQDLDEILHTSLKDYMKLLIKTHLEKAEIILHVEEDIDVSFQLEIAGTVGVSFWFDLDIATYRTTPIPPWRLPVPMVSPSFGWFLSLSGGSATGTTASSLPAGESQEVDKDGNPKFDSQGKPIMKWDSIADKLTPARAAQQERMRRQQAKLDAKNPPKNQDKNQNSDPDGNKDPSPISDEQDTDKIKHQWPLPILDLVPLRISLSIALEAHVNATLPGFHVNIPAGGHMKWMPLLENKDDRFENSITMTTEYLKARLEFHNPSVVLRMSAGPAWKFKLIPIMDQFKKQYSFTGISDPLAMGGMFQPVRFDHIFSLASPNDQDNCVEKHVKYEAVYRIGMDAYVMVFFQRIVDLSWIGTLQKSNVASEMVRGLWWSKRVAVVCMDATFDIEDKNRKLNEFLSKLQQPIADAVAEIGQFVSSKANRPKGFEQGVQSWDPNAGTSRELIDLLDWMHFTATSEPGLAWKDCDATHVELGCDTNDPFEVADNSASCPEEGMCDPWSTFYIPAGISESINDAHNEWMRSQGIDPAKAKELSHEEMYNESMRHNFGDDNPPDTNSSAVKFTASSSTASIHSLSTNSQGTSTSASSSVTSDNSLSEYTSMGLDASDLAAWVGRINYNTDGAPSATSSAR